MRQRNFVEFHTSYQMLVTFDCAVCTRISFLLNLLSQKAFMNASESALWQKQQYLSSFAKTNIKLLKSLCSALEPLVQTSTIGFSSQKHSTCYVGSRIAVFSLRQNKIFRARKFRDTKRWRDVTSSTRGTQTPNPAYCILQHLMLSSILISK